MPSLFFLNREKTLKEFSTLTTIKNEREWEGGVAWLAGSFCLLFWWWWWWVEQKKQKENRREWNENFKKYTNSHPLTIFFQLSSLWAFRFCLWASLLIENLGKFAQKRNAVKEIINKYENNWKETVNFIVILLFTPHSLSLSLLSSRIFISKDEEGKKTL